MTPLTQAQACLEALKPCPFCGGGAEYIFTPENPYGAEGDEPAGIHPEKHVIKCSKLWGEPQCVGYIVISKKTKMEAMKAWNTRAQALVDTLSKQQPDDSSDKWEDVHLRVFKDDQYKGPGHRCISYRGVIYKPERESSQQPTADATSEHGDEYIPAMGHADDAISLGESSPRAAMIGALCDGYNMVQPLDPKEPKANRWRMANALSKLAEQHDIQEIATKGANDTNSPVCKQAERECIQSEIAKLAGAKERPI